MSRNFGGATSSTMGYPAGLFAYQSKLFVLDYHNERIMAYPLGPQNGSFSVNALSSATLINLNLGADDAKDFMASEDSNFTGATWQSYNASSPFTLSSGDGTKTIYVKMRDYANYEGSSLSATTTLDTTGPTGTAQINAGATLTNTTAVTLNLSSADSAQMKISNLADFAGASWEAYAETKAHTLTTGDGLKTVYVKFKDLAGNQSETATATITLDTTKPNTTITDLGLITNVPDKSPLFYYFTSQTPRIKGTTEALSTVHFKHEDEDYTTTAGADGKYAISLPELPREQIDLTYYAVDLAGNQGKNRTLTLVIGVENFPADEVAVEESGTEESIPSGEPTPSTTPTITVYGITVVDADGKSLPNTSIYINGQEYQTNEEGKVYLEARPTEAMEFEVEVNGQRVKGAILGDQIQAEAVQEQSTGKDTRSYGWLWWILAILGIGGIGYGLARKRE